MEKLRIIAGLMQKGPQNIKTTKGRTRGDSASEISVSISIHKDCKTVRMTWAFLPQIEATNNSFLHRIRHRGKKIELTCVRYCPLHVKEV